MPFNDNVEKYGKAVEDGTMAQEHAVQALAADAAAQGVDLTDAGVRSTLDNWRTYNDPK